MYPNTDAAVVFDPRSPLQSNGLTICDGWLTNMVCRGADDGHRHPVYYCGGNEIEIDRGDRLENAFVRAHQSYLEGLARSVWCVVGQYQMPDGRSRWTCGTFGEHSGVQPCRHHIVPIPIEGGG